MASGVGLDDSCLEVFNEIKLKHTLRYVKYSIADKKIVIDCKGEKAETYADFKNSLKEDEPAYAVVDVEYNTDDGRPQSKLAFVCWVPDNANVKKKMLYASSKDAIKKKLNGVHKEIQASDFDDVSEENVIKQLKN